MEYCLENEKLKIDVSSFGGELQSVVLKKNGKEYLWQGDPGFWREKAPNLFPYIARLTQGKYTLDGNEYTMPIHGIVKYRELNVQAGAQELTFFLESDDETMKQYPFRFRYEVCYRLEQNRIVITYRVKNGSSEKMYFGIGGHPGFQVPWVNGTEFKDYHLYFPEAEKPVKILFSDDCFVEGEEAFDDLEDGRLMLRHEMFDRDAIVLKNAGHIVKLRLNEGKESPDGDIREISVRFPGMDYIGFWHKPETEAPYVCIEPWSSLPSEKGKITDLARQKNLMSLEPGKVYENTWEIQLA